MFLIYTTKIGFLYRKIDAGIFKIDNSALAMSGIVIATFLIYDKDKKNRFFKKSYLLANISVNIILKIILSNLSNRNIKF